MNISASLQKFFTNLNTHKVGGVGLGTGLVSVAAIVLQNSLDKALPAHGLGVVVPAVDFYAQTLALPLTMTALGAAYLGRPKTVSP